MEHEDKQPEAILKFYLPDNEEEFWLATHAQQLYSCLLHIDQEMRALIKYQEPSDEVESLAEKIREMIYTSVDMDKGS